MTGKWLAALVLASIANPPPTQAKETVEPALLAPSTPWKIDFADDNCSIERNFGTGEDLITLRMRRRGVKGGVDILALGPLVPRFIDRPEMTFAFEPQGVKQSLIAYSVKAPDGESHYLRGFEDEFVTALQWSNDQVVRLTAGNKLDVRMAWPGAKSAFNVLQQCDDDLQKERGVDTAAIRAQKSRPIPIGSPGRWMTNDDYPSDVRDIEGVGEVVFELTVDPIGKVSACRNLMGSGWQQLDAIVCETITKRARFKPATDASGNPAVGYFINSVRFQF